MFYAVRQVSLKILGIFTCVFVVNAIVPKASNQLILSPNGFQKTQQHDRERPCAQSQDHFYLSQRI